MDTSYDTKVWKIDVYNGARTTTYRVRWVVAGRPWHESFRTHALADAFRAELLRATRRGEAFLVETGRPTSMDRAERRVNWLVFAREYAAMKWRQHAPNSRRNTARALTNATLAMITNNRNRPDDKDLRTALAQWAFTLRPQDDAVPDNVAHALAWLERNTHEVGDLAKPAVARTLLDGLGTTRDGRTAAPATVQRQRAVVVNLAEYAMERRLLTENPITALPRKAPKIAQEVDRRVVVNPVQARALLDAVAAEKPSGDRLVAFFGAMYYAALRPAEAMTLRKVNLALPAEGWGELLLDSSSPVAGSPWTDSGRRREERPLKHRARGETRVVPCPPALTALLHVHVESFGNSPDGLLFRGIRGGDISESTYCRVWRKARITALSVDEVRSPLARRPYDLRHAAVSTWLNAGVPATQVAAWAGHSVAVLLQIYAKCLVGQEDTARRRIDAVLGS